MNNPTFERGDIVEFCDENYIVIENNGSTGTVSPLGETFYIRNFYWNFQGSETKFVRKPTKEELWSIGDE